MSATPAFTRDEDRWGAVVRRDRQADGVFCYAVRTTGVYCRPSCASRRARRENVRFYTTTREAERAGFRPCKRCRPGEPSRGDERAVAVARACRLIETAEDLPGLGDLAKAAGMSRFHFHRVFKAVTIAPAGCARSCHGATR
jgi:AraC family transcriptional regulator of adaptative response/methylated-DNA-[protein]-cysteine methyltransferase